MKTLYLIYKSCSKHFAKEIFLILQITTVIILLNTAITPFVNNFRLERAVLKGIPENAVYCSRPTFYYEGEKNEDPFKIFNADTRVENVCMTYYTSGEVNGLKADILLYSKGVFDNFSSVLKNGHWTYDTSGIYLNEALQKYTSGKRVSVDVSDGTLAFSDEYGISGTTNKEDIVYRIDVGGSAPEISQIAVNFEYIRNISTAHTPFLAIIPFDFDGRPDLLSSLGGSVLVLKSGVDPNEYVSDLSEKSYSGQLCLLSELRENSRHRIEETYKFDSLLAVLLAVSAVFGISGYTYLKTKSLQKQMGIYKICGCKNTAYAKIILLTNLILVTVSSLAAFLLRNIISLGEGNDSAASFLISITFIVFICLAPIIITLSSVKRLTFSELLYFGD